jgi:hypothetical protein
MGNGVYAALTRSLKQKLSDLAAVLETDKKVARCRRSPPPGSTRFSMAPKSTPARTFARRSTACARRRP